MVDKIKLSSNMSKLDNKVRKNFEKVNIRLLILPFTFLFLFFCFFAFYKEGTFVNEYIESQKDLFLKLNGVLCIYPNLEGNLTQLGNALILFPFVLILLHISPKFWEVLLTSSIITLIVSALFKRAFHVPRPAAVLDVNTFTVVGKANILHTSFPSGHSMTVFAFATILLYAFMPKKKSYKVFWSVSLVAIGLFIAFSRVAVGAHYPLDVIIGSIIGYISVIISIRMNANLDWLYQIKNRRMYPIVLFILSVWAYLITLKIIKYHLVIFYLSLTALIITFAVIANKYVKKIKA